MKLDIFITCHKCQGSFVLTEKLPAYFDDRNCPYCGRPSESSFIVKKIKESEG
jgi:hypothetical protein